MRLSELTGRTVVDVNGALVGSVADVILVQDGPKLGPHAASFRVAGLIVVERRHTQLLGHERDAPRAPLHTIVRRLTGEGYNVPWQDVAGVSQSTVHLNVRRGELERHMRGERA